jgi:hypothetical protein
MFDHAGSAAEIVGGRHDLPAFPRGGGEKSVDLGAIADAIQQGLAAMDEEIVQSGTIIGKAVRLVEDSSQKNLGHALSARASPPPM